MNKNCPWLGAAKPQSIKLFSLGQEELLRMAATAEKWNSYGIMEALGAHVGTYDALRKLLADRGFSPAEIEERFDSGLPSSARFAEKKLFPWIRHLACGGTCQHKQGHM